MSMDSRMNKLKEYLKKAGAFLLAFFLVFSLIPFSAVYAEGEEETDIEEPEPAEEPAEQQQETEDQQEDTAEEAALAEESAGDLSNDRTISETEFLISDYADADACYAAAEAEGEKHDRHFVGQSKDDEDDLTGYLLTTIDYPKITAADDEKQLVITSEPEDRQVSWPEGASYSVEVNDPSLVAEYHWQLFDDISIFQLDGASASTADLIVPSTDYFYRTYYYFCDIKDIYGHWHSTRDAKLECIDPYTCKRVLYFGEYAIQPGDPVFDLEEHGIGTGTVTYDANGKDITFDHVNFVSDQKIVYDSLLTSSGFMLSLRDLDRLEPRITDYYIHLVGDCSLTNNLYCEDTLSTGITCNIFFNVGSDTEEWPKVTFDGDGSLAVQNGYGIYCDGDLKIDADYTYSSTAKNSWSEIGVSAVKDIEIGNDVRIDIDCMGSGLDSRTNIMINDGAQINIKSTAVAVVGTTLPFFRAGGIWCDDYLQIGNAEINIELVSDPQVFIDTGLRYTVSGFYGVASFGDAVLDQTKVSISADMGETDTCYGVNINGLYSYNELTITNGAEITVDVKADPCLDSAAVSSGGNINIEKGTVIDAGISSMNGTSAVRSKKDINITEASVSAKAATTKTTDVVPMYPTEYTTFGMLAENINIDNKTCAETVYALAEDTTDEPQPVVAMAANRNQQGGDVVLGADTEAKKPEKDHFGTGSFELMILTIPNPQELQAVIDTQDPAAPAAEAEIRGIQHDFDDWTVIKEPTVQEEGIEQRTCTVCSETEESPIDKLDPSVIGYTNTAGDGQKWTKGTKNTASFTFSRSEYDETTFEHFTGIQIDGNDVPADKYSARAGSVIIELKPEYLETLSIGEHTLTAVFDDGSASARFTVAAARSLAVPNTSDTNHTYAWAAVLFLSMMTAAGIFLYQRHHSL